MPPPSECVGLAVGRLLAATPRRARVLDLSAYKLTLPHAAVETLAAAAPALTVLMLGACSDQEIESVATVFGERLTVFSTKGSLDITDGATVALCKYCPRLQILKLGDSPFLTDATLVLLADKGGLPRLKGFWAGSIRFSGAKMASINERNSAHERAYRGTYRDAPPFGSIFSGASGDEYGAWACEGPCYTGLRPRNTADVTDPRNVERCYECGVLCAQSATVPRKNRTRASPAASSAARTARHTGTRRCSGCNTARAANDRARSASLLPGRPGGYSEDDARFR